MIYGLDPEVGEVQETYMTCTAEVQSQVISRVESQGHFPGASVG